MEVPCELNIVGQRTGGLKKREWQQKGTWGAADRQGATEEEDGVGLDLSSLRSGQLAACSTRCIREDAPGCR